MPRPKVKKLFERIGHPQIKPQAGEATFGYVAPARGQAGNELEQLGKALNTLGSAAGSMLAAKSKEEASINLKLGESIAQRQQSYMSLRDARAKGLIPEGADPNVSKGYLITSGAMFAQSQEAARGLNRNLDELLKETVNRGGSYEEWITTLDSQIDESLGNLLEQTENNFYTRNVGFMGAITPIVDKQKELWMNRYFTNTMQKNIDVTYDRLSGFFDKREYDKALDWFSGEAPDKDQDAKNPISPEGYKNVPPYLLLPTGQDTKAHIFEAFQDSILNSIPPKHSYRHLGSIEHAINDVKSFRKKTLKRSNARVDSGQDINPKYDALLRNLEVQHAKALDNEAERVETEKTDAKNWLNTIMEMAGGEIWRNFSKNNPDEVTDLVGETTVVGSERLPVSRSKLVGLMMTALKAGDIKDPETGQSIVKLGESGKWMINPNSSFKPNPNVMSYLNGLTIAEAVDAASATINNEVNAFNANRTQQLKLVDAINDQALLEVTNGVRSSIAAMNKWNERDIHRLMADAMVKFGIDPSRVDMSGTSTSLIDELSKSFPSTLWQSKPVQDEAIDNWAMEISRSGVLPSETELIRQGNLAGFHGSYFQGTVKRLQTTRGKYYKLLDIRTPNEAGNKFALKMFDMLVGLDPESTTNSVQNLQKLLKADEIKLMANQSNLRNLNVNQTILLREIQKFLDEEYVPLVKEISKDNDFDMEKVENALASLMLSGRKGPIIVDGKELRKNSLYVDLFLRHDDWAEWMSEQVKARAKAIRRD